MNLSHDEYLRRDNPILLHLEAEYAKLNWFEHSLWEAHQNNFDLRNFRADGAYLGQGALRGIAQYRAMWEHIRAIDAYHWWVELKEDYKFGVYAPDVDGASDASSVSRDRCDSIMELYFLREHLGAPLRYLDIGAGYGRFAHRLTALYPKAHITCIDAVPVSTFLCDFYAKYRGFADQCEVVPLYDIDDIQPDGYDVAVNIHSWSECSSSAINFWLDRLVAWRVPYLFVVPHDPRWVCVEPDLRIGEFQSLILAHGYHLKVSRPKYPDGVDGLYPEVHYFLFERQA